LKSASERLRKSEREAAAAEA